MRVCVCVYVPRARVYVYVGMCLWVFPHCLFCLLTVYILGVVPFSMFLFIFERDPSPAQHLSIPAGVGKGPDKAATLVTRIPLLRRFHHK